MKKLISFLCAICLALSAMPVFAALRYQYGALVASATMEGSTTTYITNHNNGGFDLGRTTELSHTGDYSYYIDTKSPAAATDIEYTQQFSVDISNLKNNKLYLEMYTTYNQASVWYYSDGTLVTTEALYVEDADENGWRKCWRIIESNNYDADSISISSF